ncbi:hypothetical protein ACFSUJ_09595 [Streptomyces lusitanus]|uniref:Uncharacterized protein n=1 Tax=Streptomyces lusitanus TaxID=68232 RepID=A0ABU3JIY3_9ACTN|nr:hypothetical protein [Streptomyces lusitanus]
MTYLAAFEGKGGHAVDRSVLAGALRTDWPGANVSMSGDDTPGRDVRDVTWQYEEAGHRLEGRSHVDGTCLYLEGPLHLAVRFAVWYRRLVPPMVELILCDDAYGFAVTVDVEVIPATVERAVRAHE